MFGTRHQETFVGIETFFSMRRLEKAGGFGAIGSFGGLYDFRIRWPADVSYGTPYPHSAKECLVLSEPSAARD